jgi:hypothetical protein
VIQEIGDGLGLLLAVEKSGGEKDQGHGEGEFGVGPVSKSDTDAPVDYPDCTAGEPYPREPSHSHLDVIG